MRRLPWFRPPAAGRRPLVGVLLPVLPFPEVSLPELPLPELPFPELPLPELPLPELPRRAPRPIPVAASIGEGRLPHRPSGVRACGSGWCGQTPRSAAQCTGKPAAPRSGSELPYRIGPHRSIWTRWTPRFPVPPPFWLLAPDSLGSLDSHIPRGYQRRNPWVVRV